MARAGSRKISVTVEDELIVGSIGISFTDIKPEGTLWLDGSALPLDVAYDALDTFYKNGGVDHIYGTDGFGRAYLPNPEGYGLRVVGCEGVINPDSASRLDRGDGTTGDFVGTIENDDIKQTAIQFYAGTYGEYGQGSHTTLLPDGITSGNLHGYEYGTGTTWADYEADKVRVGDGSETRMKNIGIKMYVYYM